MTHDEWSVILIIAAALVIFVGYVSAEATSRPGLLVLSTYTTVLLLVAFVVVQLYTIA